MRFTAIYNSYLAIRTIHSGASILEEIASISKILSHKDAAPIDTDSRRLVLED
ncbi:hypothetical protein S7335_3341 [Synechococcus sp. PCC 7335]|nr:hypothetical protein S7335_3341 [Synechococcus sp. PCC 7335]